ncbi:uncharacterized protein LOC142776558 isoform X2 [Rhipicephalus microplus]|uniref:uncharacterized protein LOC142776558 isoform X2 n=1 Tax=Rhipicephalus microplus TaxID=6941 RepID=UPI003F6A8463
MAYLVLTSPLMYLEQQPVPGYHGEQTATILSCGDARPLRRRGVKRDQLRNARFSHQLNAVNLKSQLPSPLLLDATTAPHGTPTRQPVVSFSTEEIRRDPLPSSRNPILNAGAPIMQPVFGIPVEEIRQGTHPSSRDPMFNAGAPIMQPVFGIPVEEIRQGTHPSSRDPMFNAGAPIMQPVFGIPVEEIRQGTHPSSRDLMFNSGAPIMQPAVGIPVEEIRRGTHPSSRDPMFNAGAPIMQPAFSFPVEEIRRGTHPSSRDLTFTAEVTVIAENQPVHLEPTHRYQSMGNNGQLLLLPPTPGYGMPQPAALPAQLPQPQGVPFSAAAAPCCDECLSLQLLSCGVAQPLRTVALPSTVTSLPTQPVQVLPNTLPTSSHFAMNDGRSAW